MKKISIILMALAIAGACSAQVYFFTTSGLAAEYEDAPDSVVTVPLYRTPLPAQNTGALHGVFSVSADRKVRFSQANLQYETATGHWRFAPYQYDTVGGNIANPYIDQFGFGTSGWEGSGAAACLPTATRTDEEAYYAYIGEYPLLSLTGYMNHRDWGIHNAIENGGNQPGLWRTMTNAEWKYVLSNRWTPYAIVIVNGIWGVVVLPDGWDEAPNFKFRPCYYDKNWQEHTSLTQNEIDQILALCNNDTLSYNARAGLAISVLGKGLDIEFYSFMPGYTDEGEWAERPIEDYSITPEEWREYEDKGCVFLPFNKSRSHPRNSVRYNDNDPEYSSIRDLDYYCYYWSTDGQRATEFEYQYNSMNNRKPHQFSIFTGSQGYLLSPGGCVRLVQDYQIEK